MFEMNLKTGVASWLCVNFSENRSIHSTVTAFFRNPTWWSAAILDFPLYRLWSNPQKSIHFLIVYAKFRESWSICCRVTAFFPNPRWRSAAIVDSPLCKYRGKSQYRSCLLLVCVKIRENWSIRFRVTAFFEIQYGGRSPSWIPEKYAFGHLALNRMPSNANFENFMPMDYRYISWNDFTISAFWLRIPYVEWFFGGF
jgi:hypothetical protein